MREREFQTVANARQNFTRKKTTTKNPKLEEKKQKNYSTPVNFSWLVLVTVAFLVHQSLPGSLPLDFCMMPENPEVGRFEKCWKEIQRVEQSSMEQ